MAKKSTNQESTTNIFVKGLVKDFDETFYPEGSWAHARNAVNNSIEGDLGMIGNEPSNLKCAEAPYQIIGAIHMYKSFWVIYSTDNTNSEIGLYDESRCTYRTIVNDPCLNFSTFNIVTGASKERFDCSWQVYWADGRNPDRTLNVGLEEQWPTSPYLGNNYYSGNKLWPGVAWNQSCTDPDIDGPCIICTDLNTLNCEKLRIQSLVDTPCINITLGDAGGNLLNGSYFAVMAYSINGQKVTDYLAVSNVQPIFDHNAGSGAINITFTNIDSDYFSEFELVVVSTVAQQTVAKRIGTYSTQTSNVYLDFIDIALPSVPVELIPFRTPAYDKSDSMFEIGPYLTKVGPTTKYDFNYQPLANQIQAKWVVGRYPKDYYRNGGYIASYMRDEIYTFWIRWIYNTGDKSSSYHIPGRAPLQGELQFYPAGPSIYSDGEFHFEINNTAVDTTNFVAPLPAIEDGGVAVAEGNMGYFQSTEIYPDNMPEVWNASHDPELSGIPADDTRYDLCGLNIRYHRMPEDFILGNNSNVYCRNYTTGNGAGIENEFIQPLGVQFENIKPPVYRDDNGNIKVVPGVVGYEILRGSRAGNKTIIAKGILNNMRGYSKDTDNVFDGYYQNYPYNPTTIDPTLVDANDKLYSGNVNQQLYTFHSPDTQFARPYLSVKESRLYSVVGSPNNMTGNFREVPGHPKHKIITDLALITSYLLGLANALLTIRGKKTQTSNAPRILNIGYHNDKETGQTYLIGTAPGPLSGQTDTTPEGNAPDNNANVNDNGSVDQIGYINDANDQAVQLFNGPLSFNDILDIFSGDDHPNFTSGDTVQEEYDNNDINKIRGMLGYELGFSQEFGLLSYSVAGVFGSVMTFNNYWTASTQSALDLIRATVPYRQYAYALISHAYLHRNSISPITNSVNGVNKRSFIPDASYFSDQFLQFNNREINNLYRPKTVGIATTNSYSLITPGNGAIAQDNSVVRIRDIDSDWNNPTQTFNRNALSYYSAIKIRYRNIYGQMDYVKQIPLPCAEIVNNNLPIPDSVIEVNPGSTTTFLTTYKTKVLFGGDTYVCRYTEKNSFFYFYEWLYNMPDGSALDYRLAYLATKPRFWVDTTEYDTAGFLGDLLGAITFPGGQGSPGYPSSLNNFDSPFATTPGTPAYQENNPSILSFVSAFAFGRRNSAFYLFQSGVRDFYVESEINTELRDWTDEPDNSGRHYDYKRFTSLEELFDTSIIKLSEIFKYDNSLSVARTLTNFVSWGSQQERDYNPTISALCYQYQPNRVLYSLPDNLEQKKDSWRVYLANNYKDFKSRVTAIKSIGKNGAIMLFENDGPLMYQGVDQLETDLGTKVTLGDGGLFSQPQQSLSNSDFSIEYGSCQDRFSITNSPVGLYWISQNQGKIFSVSEGLTEISASGMKWWFAKFLPFRLLEQFPNFELTDNPVAGIGCQSVYDNDDQLLYFTKKDYMLKPEFLDGTVYIGGNTFSVGLSKASFANSTLAKLGDPRFFDDVSWTVSYDPKSEAWISFHDWHPDLMLQTKTNFISAKGSGLWKHNYRTDSYCNFYGIDYPFEFEYSAQTGQAVNSLRSLEYFLECYTYDTDGIDRFHVLDHNFDEAIIYNTEQVSGLLRLNMAPKNDPFARLTYPRINPSSIDILYEKVEQKYRINQFWDITNDRGEFNPNAQQAIWQTQWNGYIKNLNLANLNYLKNQFERKRFRHYMGNVFFRRNVSGNVKMLMKIANNKNLNSLR